MAKKRVYDLAKELGLSNKEMLDWLHVHEYDVKVASSSLEDDQAHAVREKVLSERSPKAAAAKPASSGVVLRRKKADTLGPDGLPTGEADQAASHPGLPPVQGAAQQPAVSPRPANGAHPVNGAHQTSAAGLPQQQVPQLPVEGGAHLATGQAEPQTAPAEPEKPPHSAQTIQEGAQPAVAGTSAAATEPQAAAVEPQPRTAEPAVAQTPGAGHQVVPAVAGQVKAQALPQAQAQAQAQEGVAARPADPSAPQVAAVKPETASAGAATQQVSEPAAVGAAAGPDGQASAAGQPKLAQQVTPQIAPRAHQQSVPQTPQQPPPRYVPPPGPRVSPPFTPRTNPQSAAAAAASPSAATVQIRPTAEIKPPPPVMSNVPAGVAKVTAKPAPPPPARVVRPPPPPPTGPIVRGPGGTQSVQTADHAARPTSTRAVVVSRPLIPIARPAPRPGPGGTPGPGGFRPRPAGEVRELAVVSGGPGRGREFIDVTKDKAKGKKGPRVEKVETLSKQDLVALAQQRSYVPLRGHKKKTAKKGRTTEITEMSEHKKVLRIEDSITVAELSQSMGIRGAALIAKLVALGKMVTINQPVDLDTASLLALDYGWKVEKVGFEIDDFLPDVEDRPEDQMPRPPVVTIMGHVDHGKTSLLDAIRKTTVAAGEAGGITQHIGAYSVDVVGSDGGEANITFLDTPGHEAFTAMRARGANVTDVAVLVVSADDGVMPQTIESINHAKAAKTVIVVAINKIDKPGAQPDRIKQQLSEHGLVAEDWGGDTMMVPVSARQGTNLDKLLEAILLQAEVLELKANPMLPGSGVVIESKLEKGRGPVATVLVRQGTLRVGDSIVVGLQSGRVRSLMNEHGEAIDDVPPGFPVEVLGLDGVPNAGDEFNVVEDEQAAATIADHRRLKSREAELLKTNSKMTLEDLMKAHKKDDTKELRVIVKADVGGSVEALKQALTKLSTPKVRVEILHAAVGNVSESDVMLGLVSKALVIGFNVKPESKAQETAKEGGVTLKTYTIIYEALDDVKLAMEGLLEAIIREKALGKARVQTLFNVPKLGTIAGSAVTDGKITRTALVRVQRDNKPIFSGKVASLRRFKDDVKEVATGFECGIGIEGFNELKEGDIIEAYELETIRPSLS